MDRDPRIQKLLKKTTLESLFKCYFQRVYGTTEITEMENAMKNALAKYDKEEPSYEKLVEIDENAAEPLVKECLDRLCEKMLIRGENHSPDTLLDLAKLFIELGDHRLACEIIWCSASLSLQELIKDQKLKVQLHSHNAKRHFASALSRDIGRRFCVFEVCHSSFYTNSYDALDVKNAFEDATEFIQMLRDLELTDDVKKALEKRNFNYY